MLLVLTLVFVSFPQIDEVNAQSVIYIRANGSVEGIDKIQRNENVYTLIENIYGNIIVEKNDIKSSSYDKITTPSGLTWM